MAGKVKNTLDKVTDAVGGTAGKANAAATTSAATFVKNAAIGDLYEIEAARLALRRTSRPKVKEAAEQMMADHTTSTHHLRAALEMNETHGVAPAPSELDTRRKTMIKHLGEAPDTEFDSTYLDQQVLAHEENVSLLRSYGERGDNAQLRSVALGTLPVVERHLAMMKHLRAAL